MSNAPTNSDDIIDSRDVISRIEELEPVVSALIGIDPDEEPAKFAEAVAAGSEAAEVNELQDLYAFMADLCGTGGDEQWRGDWYPVTLIRDSYFTEYAKELVLDCDLHSTELPDYIEIDWAATARNIRFDYTSVEFDGVTYWVR